MSVCIFYNIVINDKLPRTSSNPKKSQNLFNLVGEQDMAGRLSAQAIIPNRRERTNSEELYTENLMTDPEAS